LNWTEKSFSQHWRLLGRTRRPKGFKHLKRAERLQFFRGMTTKEHTP
jgi:hypothetical protein